jgi:hypothetical protein
VRKKLGHAFSPETCAGGVVLTGGGAKLPRRASARPLPGWPTTSATRGTTRRSGSSTTG